MAKPKPIHDPVSRLTYAVRWTIDKNENFILPNHPYPRAVYNIEIETPDLIQDLKHLVATKDLSLKDRTAGLRTSATALLDSNCVTLNSFHVKRIELRKYVHKPTGFMFTITDFFPLVDYRQRDITWIRIDLPSSKIFFRYRKNLPHIDQKKPLELILDKPLKTVTYLEFYSPDILMNPKTLDIYKSETPVSPYFFHLLNFVEPTPSKNLVQLNWKEEGET